MKRWMSLAVGIGLVVASCSAQGGTDDASAAVTTVPAVSTVLVTSTTLPELTTTTTPTTTAVVVATTTPPATTIAPPPAPTTMAPPVLYEVADPANPTYFPDPLAGAGVHYGSGCSPGTSTLPDGIWFGHVTSVTENTFEFDLMCFAPLPAGSTKEDGIGDITNENPALRTVPVDPTSDVYVLDLAVNWVQQPYATWHIDPGAENGCALEWCSAVWLYVNNGEATEIVVIWTP